MNSEVDVLKAVRKTVLLTEDLASALHLPAVESETEEPGRQRHIHDALELRFLFVPQNGAASPFSRIEEICLAPPEVSHLTLKHRDLERHVTIRLTLREMYYLRGASFIRVFDLAELGEAPGVGLNELLPALEEAGYGRVFDGDHLKILLAMVFSQALFCIDGRDPRSDRRPAELIAAYIRANFFRNDLSVREIAAKMNLSANYIQIVFRERWNCTPVKYLTEIRLRNARSLLQKHRYQVKEVAAMCGWNYPHYFCRKYREFFGRLPSEES